MSQQTILVGSSANDGTGDPIRTAGQKINANFDELYAAVTGTRAANLVWCGPATGSAAAPGFRALVAADIPSLSATYLTPTAGNAAYSPLAGSSSIVTTGTVTSGTWGAVIAATGATTNHSIVFTGSGTPNFNTANAGSIQHTSATGCSAWRFLDRSGNEEGATGFANDGTGSYLQGAVYLTSGKYTPDGIGNNAALPVIIGQEGMYGGLMRAIARITCGADWKITFKTADGILCTTLTETGDWQLVNKLHIGITGSAQSVDVNGPITIGGPTGSVPNRNSDSTHTLNIIDSGANKIRMVKEGVVKVDLQINGSQLQFVDSDHGSAIPLAIKLDGSGHIVCKLPTANPGAGFLWNDGGTPAIGT